MVQSGGHSGEASLEQHLEGGIQEPVRQPRGEILQPVKAALDLQEQRDPPPPPPKPHLRASMEAWLQSLPLGRISLVLESSGFIFPIATPKL